jgi:hypothetical protein
MLGRCIASQIASASARSFFWRLCIGLDVLRRHQPHRMAEPGDLSCPEVRPGTRLHPNHAWRQVGEERQYRVPAQTLRHNHLALCINAVNLKHRLRQIETDECR